MRLPVALTIALLRLLLLLTVGGESRPTRTGWLAALPFPLSLQSLARHSKSVQHNNCDGRVSCVEKWKCSGAARSSSDRRQAGRQLRFSSNLNKTLDQQERRLQARLIASQLELPLSEASGQLLGCCTAVSLGVSRLN